jgi:hypothetical protein
MSFCLLAASGFLFALLGSHRLFGVFLLLHVTLGGVFAVCLPLTVILWARYYMFDTGNPGQVEGPSTSEEKPGQQWQWKKIFFWTFMVSGFFLIVSALTLMLPYFSLIAQLDLFEVHRYSALVSLLSAVAFTRFSRVNDEER